MLPIWQKWIHISRILLLNNRAFPFLHPSVSIHLFRSPGTLLINPLYFFTFLSLFLLSYFLFFFTYSPLSPKSRRYFKHAPFNCLFSVNSYLFPASMWGHQKFNRLFPLLSLFCMSIYSIFNLDLFTVYRSLWASTLPASLIKEDAVPKKWSLQLPEWFWSLYTIFLRRMKYSILLIMKMLWIPTKGRRKYLNRMQSEPSKVLDTPLIRLQGQLREYLRR